MREKINRKKNFQFLIFILLFFLLIYTRFINIGWGLPYPMHPDERNMAIAVQNLNCNIKNQALNIKDCFNPDFFAYGQLPLYLAYFLIWAVRVAVDIRAVLEFGKINIGFEEAVIGLRAISATASVLNAIIIINIIKILINKARFQSLFPVFLIIAFSPFFIQSSHFGTTESLLMLFYSLIIYFSIGLLERRATDAVMRLALVSGSAIATKISSIIFIIVPLIAILSGPRLWDRYKNIIKFGLLTIVFTILLSPHNLINFHDFFSSMRYESDIATGNFLVFYTRQFFNAIPIWFQLTKVFPYALGWPVFILGTLGFFRLSWKDKRINFLRFAILVYLIPNAFLYVKWTRFMSPIFPLMSIFAVLFLLKIKNIKIIKTIIIIIAILPGIVYLSVYQNPDVRFQASDWIYKNIPENSYILSETANVVNLPLPNKDYGGYKNYNIISFNFYDLDNNFQLQLELKEHLKKADYIFVPSRRIFANHPKDKYPLLNDYYEKLFSGKLGFAKVAEFKLLSDEEAEETWTVFDHPTIRIYKKVKVF